VVLHPDYVRSKKDHDLALLIFEKPGFKVTEFVRPICLWNEDYDFNLIAGAKGDVRKSNFYTPIHSTYMLYTFY